MTYSFVDVDAFTPNLGQWTAVGDISSWKQSGNLFTLERDGGYVLLLTFLGPECFRVRFRPVPNPDYSTESSAAVVSRDLGSVSVSVQNNGDYLCIDTGTITVRLDLKPYRISVYRGTQLICADSPSYNLVFIPGQEVIANFKTYPTTALYCGFGEKAGTTLFKQGNSMTAFNYDNYSYQGLNASYDQPAGPQSVTEPLYCSIPLLIEINPSPVGDYAGAPYTYGIFFDNPSQSYINIGKNDYSDMGGKYYFGALYGEMDYYFMAGASCADVLTQYTGLTGRAPMPPKYVFGFHQGGYGYFDRYVLARVANSYRAAKIPIDGLHIDVDFQNNYRTFTHSEIKFPNVQEMMNNLHTIGFKCSTNITPLLTDNPLDEDGEISVYQQRADLIAAGALLPNQQAGALEDGQSGDNNQGRYQGEVSYGTNNGNNPYPYPPLVPNGQSGTPLSAFGNYSDYGRAEVRPHWGQQYRHLIQEVGMDMIWQDMMCPAINANTDQQPKTFPLGLLLDNGQGQRLPNAKLHNIYGLNLLDATWNGITALRKEAKQNKRSFIIARGGYAGMQRYAGLWTGDSPSSWDYLSILVPQVLNLGLSGVPISGADVGGFAVSSDSSPSGGIQYGKVYGGITDPTLLTRWMQVGAFLPWYRNHYDGYNKQYQEVYAYDEPVPSNCRTYVELRYRMLQMFYDGMYEWTQTGVPFCRPLFLNDPGDPQVYQSPWVDTELFVGQNILIAPILTPNNSPDGQAALRNVYLPAGSDWYAFKNNQYPLDAPVAGGTTIDNWYATLDLVPIYIRAGAILVMRELEQYVGQLAQNPLTINIYPGPDSAYQLYQDDGISCDAEDDQKYRLTQITHTAVAGGQSVRVQRLVDQYTPAEPFYYVALLGTQHPSAVTLAGAALTDVSYPESLAAAGVSAYYWNSSIQITFVKVFDTQADLTITALYA